MIVALTTSSGNSFEDAGRSDVGEAGTSSGFTDGGRRPNEIRDPALESMGLRGVIQDLPPELAEHWHGKQSKNIGYRPYCPPWEYLTKGPNEKGEYEYDPTAADEANIGGPDGTGGVYSSKPGCFAPCYWSFTPQSGRDNGPHFMRDSRSSLSYFDDNRVPERYQVRLGVNYRRIDESDTRWNNIWLTTKTRMNQGTDIEDQRGTSGNKSRDRKLNIATRIGISPGNRNASEGPGLPSLTQTLIDLGIPTIFIPNFLSRFSNDPGGMARNNNQEWIDENWEYRADPINRTCTIVNVTLEDKLVCSSEWQYCNTPS